MSKVLIEEQTLYDIGDAIRASNNLPSQSVFKPSEMPSMIINNSLNLLTSETVDSLSQASGQTMYAMPSGIAYSDNYGDRWTTGTMTLNGETVACMKSPDVSGTTYLMCTPIDLSVYKKMYMTLGVSKGSGSAFVARILSFSRPTMYNKYGGSDYSNHGQVHLMRRDSSTISASDIEAQPEFISLHANDDGTITPQTVIFDLSKIGSSGSTYIGLYGYHVYINVREIYCTQ